MTKKVVVFIAIGWLIILVAGVTSSVTLSIAGADSSAFTTNIGSAKDVVVSEEEYRMLERYARLDEVYHLIQNNYYIDVDDDELMLGAIDGMLSSLQDPYSYYETPEDVETELEHQTGEYHGVGLQLMLTENNEVLITRVFKNTPAEEAGFQIGDVILAVNGVSLSDYGYNSLDMARQLIVGEIGTFADVQVRRGDDIITISVTHADIVMNRVEYSMLENGIGYVLIYEFMGDDVAGFREALTALKEEKAQALVIDIRSNPGGLLSDVVDIADMLLGEGLIVYVEDRSGSRDNYYSDAEHIEMPMAVLVNGNSASASEILAGALQDHGVATVIGETTFGKGIVQSIISFPEDGAGLHLTTARYFTPNGRSIHGTGIEPDIPVEQQGSLDAATASIPDPEHDAQLRKAVEYLEDLLI